MANEAKRIGDHTSLSAPNGNTVLLVDHTSNGYTNTYSLTVTNLAPALLDAVPGPYANDAVANTNSIDVGKPYYDASGVLRIRIA